MTAWLLHESYQFPNLRHVICAQDQMTIAANIIIIKEKVLFAILQIYNISPAQNSLNKNIKCSKTLIESKKRPVTVTEQMTRNCDNRNDQWQTKGPVTVTKKRPVRVTKEKTLLWQLIRLLVLSTCQRLQLKRHSHESVSWQRPCHWTLWKTQYIKYLEIYNISSNLI